MQIFVMRHGQAKPENIDDHLRELTENGHRESKVIGQWINKTKIVFDRILVSPYIRAQQTANSLLSEVDSVTQFETLDIITPLDSSKTVHDYIDGVCEDASIEKILIISHMPLVSFLVAELTFNHDSPIFQTAAIAQIDYDKAQMAGSLVKLLAPNELI